MQGGDGTMGMLGAESSKEQSLPFRTFDSPHRTPLCPRISHTVPAARREEGMFYTSDIDTENQAMRHVDAG